LRDGVLGGGAATSLSDEPARDHGAHKAGRHNPKLRQTRIQTRARRNYQRLPMDATRGNVPVRLRLRRCRRQTYLRAGAGVSEAASPPAGDFPLSLALDEAEK
jgi:hypothetical protein